MWVGNLLPDPGACPLPPPLLARGRLRAQRAPRCSWPCWGVPPTGHALCSEMQGLCADMGMGSREARTSSFLEATRARDGFSGCLTPSCVLTRVSQPRPGMAARLLWEAFLEAHAWGTSPLDSLSSLLSSEPSHTLVGLACQLCKVELAIKPYAFGCSHFLHKSLKRSKRKKTQLL